MNFCFLFDYDGVLVKKLDFAGSLSNRYGTDSAALASFFRNHLKKCLEGKADMIELLTNYLEAIRWDGSSMALFKAIYLEVEEYDAELMSWIVEELSGRLPCYIATNQDWHRFRAISSNEKIKPVFDQVFCSCQLGVAKPQISYFKRIYEKLIAKHPNLPIENVIFVDDLQENVESAAEFGFRSHRYSNFLSFKSFVDETLPGFQ